MKGYLKAKRNRKEEKKAVQGVCGGLRRGLGGSVALHNRFCG